jgi:tRNA-2-methylthio-N6-dimethylallyladenosine synthase
MVGSVQRVLVEGPSRKTVENKTTPQMSGRSENGRIVNFDGDATLTGRFVDVQITAAWTNSLQAEVIAVLDDNPAREAHSRPEVCEVRTA